MMRIWKTPVKTILLYFRITDKPRGMTTTIITMKTKMTKTMAAISL